jgi:hypothetical protein
VKLAKKRQAGRSLPLEQQQDDREIRGAYPLIERLIVFEDLPIADSMLSY